MTKFFVSALVLFCVSVSVSSSAEEFVEHTGMLDLKLTNIPTFEDYAVPVSENIKIADDVDFDSYKGSWGFRTRLRKGLKAGPNFADKYIVVTHGCGTSCQVNWILNAETGKILDRFPSTYGASYHRDSRLIIRNNPDFTNVEPEYYSLLYVIDYYKIWNDELRLLKRLDIREMHPNISEINEDMRKEREKLRNQ